MVCRCRETMAYLAPLVRGFVNFVNRLTNATEPELGARPLVRGLVGRLLRLTGLTKPEQGVPPPATPGRTFSPCPYSYYSLRASRVTAARARAAGAAEGELSAISGGAEAEKRMSCLSGRTVLSFFWGALSNSSLSTGKLLRLLWAVRQGGYGNPTRVRGDVSGACGQGRRTSLLSSPPSPSL